VPLVNGKFERLRLPSEKHRTVIFSPGRKNEDGSITPWRERWLYGGRNGYKDWSFAAAAIEIGVRVSKRFLFTREVQLTIADSAHKLLCDTIKRLGYLEYFDIQKSYIYGRHNDTEFQFRGLNDLVSGDIKSTEAVDIAVLCEAQNLSEKSWVDFNPTIRKPGSEIWGMFNTQFDTDFVYRHVVLEPHDRLISSHVNYTDTDAPQKMLSDEVVYQAEEMKKKNFKLYLNVWLGEPRSVGLFFHNFGEHNKCQPFVIPDQDDTSHLFGALDHGIAHNTSFGLYYQDGEHVYKIFTYSANGGTTRSHADAIVEKIEACHWTRHLFPCEIYYDYAMDTKHRLNERTYKSDLDEYKEAFSMREASRGCSFVPANKRKIDGCHIMLGAFDEGNGEPVFRYFDGLNDAMVHSLKSVESDDVNPEMYKKMDGDDEADETRYGVVGIVTKIAATRNRRRPKQNREKPTGINEQLKPQMLSLSECY
jgi:PBSX family phage terminase large subunit